MHHQYIFFIFVFLVYTLINIYIFFHSKQAIPRTKVIRSVLYTVYFFFYSSFIVAMLGRNDLPLSIQKALYFPGTVWLGMMMYLFMYFFIADFIFLFLRLFRLLPAAKTKPYRKFQVFSGYILVICLSIYGYYQFNRILIVEQKIEIAKNAGETKNLKVVGVSDLHLGLNIDRKRLEKYIRLINDQHPDMVIIAGDMIDNNVLPLEKERMWETLNDLNAPLGAWYCLGNHEHMIGYESGLSFLNKTNLHLLIDSSEIINGSILIIGRDDKQQNPNRKSLKELVKDTNSALPLFLLDHEPFNLEEAEAEGIDFQFSGHTHNGQLFPGNLIINRIYELPYGHKQKGKTHYYVSSGLGLWGPLMRICSQSEIVVFNFEFK